MEDRVQEEMRREGISAEKARYILKKDDEERRKWGLRVYGTDTWDSRLYDIVLHIRQLTVDDAVEILYGMVQKPAFEATPQSRKQVEDLALAARVKARLSRLAPNIQVLAQDGKLYIHHLDMGAEHELAEKIKNAAAQVEGVAEVHYNMGVPPEQRDHINPFHNIS